MDLFKVYLLIFFICICVRIHEFMSIACMHVPSEARGLLLNGNYSCELPHLSVGAEPFLCRSSMRS